MRPSWDLPEILPKKAGVFRLKVLSHGPLRLPENLPGSGQNGTVSDGVSQTRLPPGPSQALITQHRGYRPWPTSEDPNPQFLLTVLVAGPRLWPSQAARLRGHTPCGSLALFRKANGRQGSSLEGRRRLARRGECQLGERRRCPGWH